MRPESWQGHVNETILKVFKNVDSIKFLSGVVSYKINPYNFQSPVAINNRAEVEENKRL